jgi:hypothetical protein
MAADRARFGEHKLGCGVDLPDLQADRVYEPYALRSNASLRTVEMRKPLWDCC